MYLYIMFNSLVLPHTIAFTAYWAHFCHRMYGSCVTILNICSAAAYTPRDRCITLNGWHKTYKSGWNKIDQPMAVIAGRQSTATTGNTFIIRM